MTVPGSGGSRALALFVHHRILGGARLGLRIFFLIVVIGLVIWLVTSVLRRRKARQFGTGEPPLPSSSSGPFGAYPSGPPPAGAPPAEGGWPAAEATPGWPSPSARAQTATLDPPDSLVTDVPEPEAVGDSTAMTASEPEADSPTLATTLPSEEAEPSGATVALGQAPTPAPLATPSQGPEPLVTPPAWAPVSESPSSATRKAGTIEARGLVKRYGAKVAVDGLSFDVQPGHVTGFLGPNGAGKSTTMRMIMGLDAPNEGTVTVDGQSYHDLAWPMREVGALLESRAIHPGRTAYNHLWMLARTNQIPRQRVDEVLALVGLTGVAKQRAGQFSLGMTQRLGIAAALLGDPGILLFDEPVNGLDTDGIRWVRSLLRGLANEGRTVFVSSHLMSEMAMTADQVVVIGKGRLIADMPVTQFTAANARSYVRVRSPQFDQLRPALEAAGASVEQQGDGSWAVRGVGEERVGEIAWQGHVLLYELAPQSATLEDAYIESTEGDIEFRGTGSRGAVGAAERETA